MSIQNIEITPAIIILHEQFRCKKQKNKKGKILEIRGKLNQNRDHRKWEGDPEIKAGEEEAVHVPEMKRGNGNPRFRGNGGKLREKFGERTEIEHNKERWEEPLMGQFINYY